MRLIIGEFCFSQSEQQRRGNGESKQENGEKNQKWFANFRILIIIRACFFFFPSII